MFFLERPCLDRISARLLFTNNRLQIIDLRGALLSGTLRGNADISLAKNDPHYRANLSVSEINFPILTGLYFNYKTALGVLNGTYDFTGLGSDSGTMRGHGKIEVTNGDVFAIPIFGPLSGILNRIVPGSGYSIAHRATANSRSMVGLFIPRTSTQTARSLTCWVMAISIFSMTSSISMCG